METIDLTPGIQKHISISSIATYASCPHKWKLNYINKIVFPSKSPSLSFGASIHKALEIFHRAEERMSFAQFMEEFEKAFEKDAFMNEIVWETEKEKAKYIKMAEDILKDYYHIHKNDGPPASLVNQETGQIFQALELNFKVPITSPDGFDRSDICYMGFIDKIAVKGDEVTIVDYKTARYPYTTWKVQSDLQLVLYAYALKKILDSGYKIQNIDNISKVSVSYDVMIKQLTKKAIEEGLGRIQEYRKVVTNSDVQRLLRQTDFTLKGIDNSCFPANYENQWCDYCDYRVHEEDGKPICIKYD